MNCFDRKRLSNCALLLLSATLAGSFYVSPLGAQSAATTSSPAQATPSASSSEPNVVKPAPVAIPYRYRPNRYPKRATAFYSLFWGIDSPSVKAVESGELIRFSYNVLDPNKAKLLNDKKTEAYLILPAAGIRLSVPSLEKVGQLRQSSPPEAGKSYWMAFSNPGRRVKRGDRVNVVIGQFHAEGLIVD
jgi:hypothetical protein